VRTIAGGVGQYIWVDGPAAAARFQTPGRLAWTPDRCALIVADTGCGRVRKLTLCAADDGTARLADWL